MKGISTFEDLSLTRAYMFIKSVILSLGYKNMRGTATQIIACR